MLSALFISRCLLLRNLGNNHIIEAFIDFGSSSGEAKKQRNFREIGRRDEKSVGKCTPEHGHYYVFSYSACTSDRISYLVASPPACVSDRGSYVFSSYLIFASRC